MPHTAVIKVCQLLHRLHPVVLLRMIKPARTDRHITLGSRPLIAVRMSVLQFPILRISRINLSGTQERPVCRSGKSILVTYPAASGTAIREYNSLRLKLVNHFIGTRIVIVSLPVYGTGIFCSAIPAITAIGPVKPDFKHRAIIGQQLVQLSIEIIHIFRSSIIGLMPVPR